MIGIAAVAGYVPEGFASNEDRMAEFGVDLAFLDERIGTRRVSRMAPGEDTADLCQRAFEALKDKLGESPIPRVDCIVVCTQNPDGGGLPHTSALLHGRLDAPERCACFDISLGCSGYVHALGIVTAFMQANGLRCGLLFTADPYSKIVDPADRNTVMIFGDAATATLLEPCSPDRPQLTVIASRYHTEGKRAAALRATGGRLAMDGRAVFNFSARAVPVEVRALLENAGYTWQDIDFFLFHQGSRYILDAIRTRLGLPAERVPVDMARQGNTVSSSIPLMLARVAEDTAARRLVLSGFGVGLSVATCLLERRP